MFCALLFAKSNIAHKDTYTGTSTHLYLVRSQSITCLTVLNMGRRCIVITRFVLLLLLLLLLLFFYLYLRVILCLHKIVFLFDGFHCVVKSKFVRTLWLWSLLCELAHLSRSRYGKRPQRTK